MLLSLVLAGVAVGKSSPYFDGERFRVGAVQGAPDRTMTSEYEVAIARAPGHTWSFATLHAISEITGSSGTWKWTADEPRPDDPWPVSQSEAIASVPARCAVEPGGRPTALVDADRWRDDARSALAALHLPDAASESGAALVDADGLLMGLQRDFPGEPPADGSWTRVETLLGIRASRVETCTRTAEVAATTWKCAGTLAGSTVLDGLATTLEEGTSQTVLVFDDRGLRSVESRWEAMAHLEEPGGAVSIRPVGGRRLVARQDDEK
jgi:hypothetical protein